jgi:hypothetical protein
VPAPDMAGPELPAPDAVPADQPVVVAVDAVNPDEPLAPAPDSLI